MIKSTFNEAIVDPQKIGALNTKELQGVIAEFPYFSAAQILLAKKLKEEDSVLFEKQLNLTAAYIPSRKVLYNLINSSVEVGQVDEIIEHEIPPVIEAEPPSIEGQKDELSKLIESEAASLYNFDEVPSEPIEPSIKRIPPIQPDQTLNFSSWLNYFEGNKDESLKSESDLINEFIKQDPQLQVGKSEDYSPENLAKPSSHEIEVDFITETLAKIHLDQGNRMKAIEIYERLKLKYPEKSPYFAAQIEFIKQK